MDNYIIPIGELAEGQTPFKWILGKEFFESFGNDQILGAQLSVEGTAEKSGTYIGIDCTIKGELVVECDRCLGEVTYQVETPVALSVKYGEGTQESSDEGEREVVSINPEDALLDMSQIIYDYACLSLPLQRVHEEGECDMEVAGRLGQDKSPKPESANQFAALKDLTF